MIRNKAKRNWSWNLIQNGYLPTVEKNARTFKTKMYKQSSDELSIITTREHSIFTCVDTLCDSYVQDSAKEAGKAAKNAETRKHNKYKDLKDNYLFTPIAIETFGSWGPESLKFIKEVGRKIQENTGEKRSVSYLIQSLSMTVQRGNAASIMGTVGETQKLEEIYDLVTPLKLND